MTVTEKYGLKKPEPEDFYNIADFNGNMDTVEAELFKRVEKPAQRTAGNFVSLTAEGNVTDSGRNPSSFLSSTTKATDIGGDVKGTAAGVQSNLSIHISDGAKHFSQEEKAKLQNALTKAEAQAAYLPKGTTAANIGAEIAGAAAGVQSNLTAHTGDSGKHCSKAEKDKLNIALTTQDIVVSASQPAAAEGRIWIQLP